MRGSEPKDNWLFATFDLLIATAFLCLIGILFVAFCVLLGKYELLILAYVLLGAACVRSLLTAEQRKSLEKAAVLGEGMKIFNRLESYYLQHQPRSFFYYLLFPITGIWSFLFAGERGRQELKAYWGLLQWIIVLLLIGGFSSYYRFYTHFAWQSSVVWLYTELLAIYFLCNFFAVPLSTTSIRLSMQHKRIRLFSTTFVALVVMTGCVYIFSYRTNYENLVPINLMLDQRLAQLKAKLQAPQHKTKDPYFKKLSYFGKVHRRTEMFLRYHGPRMLRFNQAYFHHKKESRRELFYEKINEAYQEMLAPIASLEENEHIYLTANKSPTEVWGLICVPFRESIFYIFRYKEKNTPANERLKIYRNWKKIPNHIRRKMADMWDKNAYRFAADKRMAQVVVEFMRDKFKRASESLKSVSDAVKQAGEKMKDWGQKKEAKRQSSSPRQDNLDLTPLRGQKQKPKRRGAKRAKKKLAPLPPADSSMSTPSLPSPPPKPGAPALARRPQPKKASPPSKSTGRHRGLRKRRRNRTLLRFKTPLARARYNLKRNIKRIESLSGRLLRMMWQYYGLKPKNTSGSKMEQLLSLFPEKWDFDSIVNALHALQDQAITLKEARAALQERVVLPPSDDDTPAPRRGGIQWGVGSSRLPKLQKLKKLRAKIKRLARVSPSSQRLFRLRVRLRNMQTDLQNQSNDPTDAARHIAQSRLTKRFRVLTYKLYQVNKLLWGLRRKLQVAFQQVIGERQQYAVYDKALVSFDYPRALKEQLIHDHFGRQFAFVQKWWTIMYERFLTLIMFLFQLTMPLHIFLIIYCQLTLNETPLALPSLSALGGDDDDDDEE